MAPLNNLLLLVIGHCLVCVALAQERPQGERAAGEVTLNFPDSVPIKTLADYVSQRLNINILYDEQIGAKKVTIKAPAAIPADSLLGLLESALKMNGLALTDADQPGWKRIVQVQNLTAISLPPGADEEKLGPSSAVTRVFFLRHAQADPRLPIMSIRVKLYRRAA